MVAKGMVHISERRLPLNPPSRLSPHPHTAVVREIETRFPSLAVMMVQQVCSDAKQGRNPPTRELANRLEFMSMMTQHTEMVRARLYIRLSVSVGRIVGYRFVHENVRTSKNAANQRINKPINKSRAHIYTYIHTYIHTINQSRARAHDS